MKERLVRRHHPVFMITLVLMIIIVLYIVEMMNNPEYNIFDLIIIVATVSGALAVWYEFRKSKKLNEAVFITGLNNDFINSDKIIDIFDVLFKSRENGKYEAYLKNRAHQDIRESYLTDDDIVKFSLYLNYFEVIYILIHNKFINFDIINNLFSHRFFLIANDPVVQDRKLVRKREFYENIYTLHKLWREYRIKKGLKIHYEESCLSKFY